MLLGLTKSNSMSAQFQDSEDASPSSSYRLSFKNGRLRMPPLVAVENTTLLVKAVQQRLRLCCFQLDCPTNQVQMEHFWI